MKHYKYILSCLGLTNIVLAEENDYLMRQQEPTLEELRFMYQRNFLERAYPRNGIPTTEGESLKERLIEFNSKNPIILQGFEEFSPSRLASCFITKIGKDVSSCYLFKYVTFNKLKEYDALPENFIPVNEEIKNDQKNKTYQQIFSEKVPYEYLRELTCNPEKPCSISEQDKLSIERVFNDKSEDKAILFVGFSQKNPTEGSEIKCSSEGYRKCLFWSLWDEQPNKDHNSIKFCFCQTEKFLKQHPELENFFDYIIIGGQTKEYITTETWIALGKMLKINGRVVYPNLGNFFRGPFINKLLNSTLLSSFNVYMCDNPQDRIFKEIVQLASFNNEPYYGAFCYEKAKKLYWHKKIK